MANFAPKLCLIALGICAALNQGISGQTALGVFTAGLLSWTLLEYAVHRWILHSDLEENTFIRSISDWHQRHHQYPNDAKRRFVPLATEIGYAALAFGTCWLLSSSLGLAAVSTSGLGTGYLAYQYVHALAHGTPPSHRIGRTLRRYHLVHHYAEPRAAFGVTSPLWDFLLGTRPKQRAPLVAARTLNEKR